MKGLAAARGLSALLGALVLATAACGDSGVDTAAPAGTGSTETSSGPPTAPAPISTTAPVATTVPVTSAAPATTLEPAAETSYDPSLTREDVDCSQGALGEGGDDVFLTAHYVVDGVLGAVCLGNEDPGLLATWELLATVTPADELEPLAILAGFDSPNSDTAAFVTAIGDFDGEDFQMSMNLPFTDSTDPEFALTVVHEFGHILAGEVEQLDRFAEVGDCATYDNGDGCLLPGSYLADWVAEFWTADELAEVAAEDQEGGGEAERCNLNPAFLGEYAATNPDEDFAESFAAFVFDVDVDTPELEAKMTFFSERPALAEFRDRAAGAGLTGLPNEFEGCG